MKVIFKCVEIVENNKCNIEITYYRDIVKGGHSIFSESNKDNSEEPNIVYLTCSNNHINPYEIK